MRRVLLITYKLNNNFKDYSGLFEAIKNGGHSWFHYIEDTWIVSTTRSANDFSALLIPHIETNDRLLVVRIQHDFQGWLPKEAWDWLHKLQY